jgi:hypothetical protein
MRSQASLFLLLIAFTLPCRAQTPAKNESAVSSPSEFDLASYQQELSRIGEAAHNRAQIGELRRSLPDSWKVSENGREYTVSTREIDLALGRIAQNPDKYPVSELEARLKAMREQAAELARTASTPDVADAQGKLKKILDRGEFRASGGPSAWDLIRARINRWIFEHIMKLLSSLHISKKTGNALAWGVILLAVMLLFYVAYRWLNKSTEPLEFRAETDLTRSDARRWLEEALAAADRGEFREAVHCAYWASVAHLEDLRLLTRDRARTPRESLRLLSHRPKEQGILQAITRSFELIWYGYRPVSAEEWAGTKKELEKMGCLQGSTAPTAHS